jgi:hypothetical protein
MSTQAIQQVLERVVREPNFRDRIRQSPIHALNGYPLTPEERTVLLGGNPMARQARGVDPRLSRVSVF